MSAKMRAHPFVLCVRWDIYAKAKKWEMAAEVARGMSVMLPNNSWGWFHWAYSLQELNRTKEAQSVLLPIATKFPDCLRNPTGAFRPGAGRWQGVHQVEKSKEKRSLQNRASGKKIQKTAQLIADGMSNWQS
jgi:hypothetical protein